MVRAATPYKGTVLLIFGTRLSDAIMVIVSFVCPRCGVDAEQRVTKTANRITLFFVPLFAISTKYRVHCTNCGAATALTKKQAEHSVEWAAQQR